MSRVFISYSHDSNEHLERVLALSNLLREEGVDCHIDQYEESPPEGWPTWCTNQVEEAEFVLVVCTANYERRFRGKEEQGKGLGATWEGFVINQSIYDAQGKNAKFIPIALNVGDSEHVPVILRGATRYNLSNGDDYDVLYRRLTHQPAVVKPKLGEIRSKLPCVVDSALPALPRKQEFRGTHHRFRILVVVIVLCGAAALLVASLLWRQSRNPTELYGARSRTDQSKPPLWASWMDSCRSETLTRRILTDKTPRQLRSFYEGDGRTALQADKLIEPFKCLWMNAEGQIDSVAPSGDGFVMLLAIGGDRVECRFDHKWEEEMGRLTKGDTVRIVGRIGPFQNGAQIYLWQCELR